MNPSPFHLNTLPKGQQAVWRNFGQANMSAFTLYGGTALALQLGHRISVDFDFFSPDPVTAANVHQRVPWLKAQMLNILQEDPDTYVLLVQPEGQEESVKLSFFGNLSIPVIKDPQIDPTNAVRVAAPEDLLATKLKVLNERVEAKDYIDIAALLNCFQDPVKGLQQGLADMEGMYPEGSTAITLKTLCWFKGGNLNELPVRTISFLTKMCQQVQDLPPAQPSKFQSLRQSQQQVPDR